MPTKVAIVEDNAGICEQLTRVIARDPNLVAVCTCRNAGAAFLRIPSAQPDVIIMDIHLPDGSGIDCTARLKRQLPETQIIMFTVSDETDQIVKALEAGASGYILKDTAPTEILAAIRDVLTHGAPMSREVARKLIESFRRPSTPAAGSSVVSSVEPLTPREVEILQLLAEGLLYKEIGARLSITIDTVSSHLKSIYRKLHVRSRTEAVTKFLR